MLWYNPSNQWPKTFKQLPIGREQQRERGRDEHNGEQLAAKLILHIQNKCFDFCICIKQSLPIRDITKYHSKGTLTFYQTGNYT